MPLSSKALNKNPLKPIVFICEYLPMFLVSVTDILFWGAILKRILANYGLFPQICARLESHLLTCG